MKRKFTFLFLLGALLFMLPDNANAWSQVKLKHNINGASWGSDDRSFTKTDDYGNAWKLEINCSEENIQGDFWFRIWVSDNSKEWGPYTSDYELANEQVYGAREEYSNSFKIPQSARRHGKITIYASYINDTKWEISYGGEGWLPTESTITTYDETSDDYYFVSPELTNSQCLEYFRLQPSRPRFAGSSYSGRFFSFHLQDFVMGANSSITYWIQQKSTGKKFYPGGDAADYELGDYDMADNNSGKGVIYQSYGTSVSTAATPPYKFIHTKNKSGKQSITIFFDDNGDGSVCALLNDTYFGTGADAGAYYLVGNFSNTAHLIDPSSTDDRKLMTKYYYKDGLQYTSAIADADSLVYRVTVTQPAGGWSSLYMLVFPKTVLDSWSGSAEDYAKAIRPQTQWNYTLGDPATVDTDHHAYYEGLDATATRGGLYTRKDGAADTQQAFNPHMTDDILSYTFSMNTTTSTYTLTMNHKLFIMGPAVNGTEGAAEDGDVAVDAWKSDYPSAQTAHAYELVFDPSDKSYSYRGNGGTLSSAEQTVHLVNGQRLAFVWDKNFADVFYAEDDVKPVDLSTAAMETANYGLAESDKGNFDTQYVNFLSIYSLEKATFNPAIDYDVNAITGDKEYTVDGAVFNLPTGDYNIRLYITEIDEQQYVYYVIKDRSLPLKKVANAKNSGTELDGKAIRTFSDYHAVVLSSDVTPYFVSSYYASPGPGEGSVTLVQYPLNTGRVLPANTPVILGRRGGKGRRVGGILCRTPLRSAPQLQRVDPFGALC